MPADERIRVLHLACELGLGGTERALQHLVEGLDRSCFDVRAAGFAGLGARAELLAARGVPVVDCGGDPERLVGYLRDERVAVAHVHLPGRDGELPAAILGALGRAAPPVVVETNVFGIWHERASPDFLALRLMPSKTALIRFGSRAPAAPGFLQRHQVLYYPLDVPRLERLRDELQPARDAIRARLGLAPGDFVVGRVGRPDDAKWSPLLTQAFARLVRRRPEARLLLRAASPRARAEIAAAGWADRCLLLEPSADERVLAETYVALDVLAATSRIGESFGYAIAEGMCFRRPVVANETPRKDNAQVELIDAGRTGELAFTAGGLAAALERLAADPARRAALGAAGAAKVARLFEAGPIVRDLEVRYARLLHARGVPLPAALRARLDEVRSPAPSLDELAAWPAEYRRRMRAFVGGLPPRAGLELARAHLRARRLEKDWRR